jgi:hypothetical protein
MAMRFLINAALAVAAAAALTACGTVARPAVGHRQAHARRAKLASAVPAPRAGNRAEATALARLMLARIELPVGARRLPPTPVPLALRQPALLGLAAASLDLHELFALPESMGTAASFLAKHVPRGMSQFSSGGGLGGPAGLQNQDVSYMVRSVPAGVYVAQLALTVAADTSGGSVLRADAQVLWYPPRTAAEYIDPVRYHVLTITVTTYGTRLRRLHMVVTSAAAIAGLADVLDSSRVLPSMTISCPAGFAYYQLGFAVAEHRQPVIVVNAAQSPCEGVQVRVGGRRQPSLQDATALVDAVDRLLGIAHD